MRKDVLIFAAVQRHFNLGASIYHSKTIERFRSMAASINPELSDAPHKCCVLVVDMGTRSCSTWGITNAMDEARILQERSALAAPGGEKMGQQLDQHDALYGKLDHTLGIEPL